jgi:hypothetical protein
MTAPTTKVELKLTVKQLSRLDSLSIHWGLNNRTDTLRVLIAEAHRGLASQPHDEERK